MTSHPEVVVGVATYNNADDIDETIEMILTQTRPPNRLVFCDKSSDETQKRIRAHQNQADSPTVEIIDQSGDGVADAYNDILDHIAGEYDIFATVQTEITVNEEWLASHLKVHNKRPEIDMVMGDNKENNPVDKEVGPDERPYYVGRDFSAEAGVLERVNGWDRNFLRGEDWDMRIRLAGVRTRVYAKTEVGYRKDWSDPYISLSKAQRKPTSVTFLSKYGLWYARFHPSHVVSDGLSLVSILSAAGTVGFLPVLPALSAISAVLFTLSILTYWVAHLTLRGGVDQTIIVGPVRKQLLNGVAIVYAYNRVVRRDVEWNMNGFNPDNIPRYKF